MHVLLSNDDGYLAPGLQTLAEALRRVARVTVVAPERNRSGASNSLTLDLPLRLRQVGPEVFAVEGTPADCVNLALTGAFDARPTLVVSGINAGENLGEDVLYSGTVAAAMEGALLGLPAIAVSLAGGDADSDYSAAAEFVRALVVRWARGGLRPGALLNINVPAGPGHAAWQVTRLGRRHRDTAVIRQTDPRNRPIFWLGPVGSPGADAGPGTDFHAIAAGRVSVTPIQTDLTAYDELEALGAWLDTRPE